MAHRLQIDECYELEGDYQNQFLGQEVFPRPKYKKLQVAERSVNKIHYSDVYILQPLHYYYVTLKDGSMITKIEDFTYNSYFFMNGLLCFMDFKKTKMYLFNASQNIVYIQKGTSIGDGVVWTKIYKS